MAIERGHVRILPGRNERGEHVFGVLVKRSYRIAHQRVAERAETDAPFREADEHYPDGDSRWPVVKHESELSACKAATDVVIVGKAYAERGVPTQRLMAGVRIGERETWLAITGDRRCHHREDATPLFSEPAPFVDMELRYDRAYGGYDETSAPDAPLWYPRNFVGKGFALRNVRETIEGLALPNIEDPNDLLSPERLVVENPARWHLQPLPRGVGWRHRASYPRSVLLGGYPPFLPAGTVTAEERMGLVQRNQVALARQSRLAPFDAGYANGASIGLLFPGLIGDERIALRGMSRDGLLDFRLPGEVPRIGLDTGSGVQALRTRFHTVSIRPDDLALDIVWQAALAYGGPRALSHIVRLHAEVE